MSSSTVHAQQESHQRVGYETSDRKWAGQGIATISDRSGQVLFSVPIEFLNKGLVNKFAYVLQSIHMSYDVSDGQICSEEGVECNPVDAVTPGRFVYWNAETVCCRPRIGPRFKFMSRPPHAGDDLASTMSNSKRSSANQSKLLFTVVARDYYCLVSDVEYPSCTAAHILPVSRPEYYDEVLGQTPTTLFQTRFGILLRDDIHHAFDRGHIALYPLLIRFDRVRNPPQWLRLSMSIQSRSDCGASTESRNFETMARVWTKLGPKTDHRVQIGLVTGLRVTSFSGTKAEPYDREAPL